MQMQWKPAKFTNTGDTRRKEIVNRISFIVGIIKQHNSKKYLNLWTKELTKNISNGYWFYTKKLEKQPIVINMEWRDKREHEPGEKNNNRL